MPNTITPVVTWSTVTAPASADPLDQVQPNNTAQQLANRTEALRTFLRADRHVPALAGQPVLSGGAEMWALSTGGLPTWISQANTGEIWVPLIPLIAGDFVKHVYVMVKPGAARPTAGNRMSLTMVTRHVDWSSPSVTDTVQVSTVHDDGTTNWQKITLTPATPVAASAEQQMFARILAGNTGAASPDQIGGAYFDLDLTQVIT